MTSEPKKDSPARDFTVSVAILVVTLGGLLYVGEQINNAPAPRSITLGWDNPPEVPSSFTVEVWATTNLTTWTLKTNVSGTNRGTLPADKAREFFKVRSRDTNGSFSDWSRKPTR